MVASAVADRLRWDLGRRGGNPGNRGRMSAVRLCRKVERTPRKMGTGALDSESGTTPVPGGSRLPGVPRAQLYGELRYRKPGFFAQLEGLARSRVPVNDPNSEFAGGFGVFNAAAGLTQERARWRITEFVRIDNLADRNYAGSVIVNDGNGRYYEPSPRRNMTVGIQASLQL